MSHLRVVYHMNYFSDKVSHFALFEMKRIKKRFSANTALQKVVASSLCETNLKFNSVFHNSCNGFCMFKVFMLNLK